MATINPNISTNQQRRLSEPEPAKHSSSVEQGLKALEDKTKDGQKAGKADLLQYLKTNFDGDTFTREEFEALDKMIKEHPEKFDAEFLKGWEAVRTAMGSSDEIKLNGLKGADAIKGLQSKVDAALTADPDIFEGITGGRRQLPQELDPSQFADPKLQALALEAGRRRAPQAITGR